MGILLKGTFRFKGIIWNYHKLHQIRELFAIITRNSQDRLNTLKQLREAKKEAGNCDEDFGPVHLDLF